ncbi:MAG: hypothetical protein ACYCO5_00530 [Acidobacteriaceae bacterium]
MKTVELLHLSGYVAAFLVAMLVVVVDCNSALRAALGRVPVNVLKSPAIWVLATACGVVAAICFGFSYSDFLKQIVDLKWEYPPGRGLLVGLAVLTIIRSKFFNFKDTEIGGEYFYNSGRAWALNKLWLKWHLYKENYNNPARIQAAFLIQDFEDRVIAVVRDIIKLQPQEYKMWVQKQFDNLQQTRPAPPPNPADVRWQSYYRAFINLALDCCGDKCFSGFAGF